MNSPFGVEAVALRDLGFRDAEDLEIGRRRIIGSRIITQQRCLIFVPSPLGGSWRASLSASIDEAFSRKGPDGAKRWWRYASPMRRRRAPCGERRIECRLTPSSPSVPIKPAAGSKGGQMRIATDAGGWGGQSAGMHWVFSVAIVGLLFAGG